MPRLAIALVGLAVQPVVAGAAFASAGMVCDALDGSDASVEMNLPRDAGMPPNWVRIHAHGKLLSSLGMDEDAIVISNRQSFEDADSFFIDLADQSWSGPTVKIRLLKGAEDDDPPVLQVAGEGITPISCTEDE